MRDPCCQLASWPASRLLTHFPSFQPPPFLFSLLPYVLTPVAGLSSSSASGHQLRALLGLGCDALTAFSLPPLSLPLTPPPNTADHPTFSKHLPLSLGFCQPRPPPSG